jgi:hypothetical protein
MLSPSVIEDPSVLVLPKSVADDPNKGVEVLLLSSS